MPSLIETIKRVAIDAVEASKPTSIVFGTVSSINPLRIDIEQRLQLTESHLILTSLVSDFQADVTLENNTRRNMTFHFGLKKDEKVILLRVQGGQKYIVLDKVR